MPDNLFPGERIEKINVAEEIRIIFGLFHVGHHFPGIAGCAGRVETFPAANSYAMHGLGLLPGRASSKCAGIVGETMKTYHPHGDGAIYPTLGAHGRAVDHAGTVDRRNR